jgi:predicted anti-sigma-YlaC factor YlaD
MECFEARNQLNDWIDGSMSSKTHQDFESHLETCRNCGNQNLHIRALIETLQKQPRAQMPPELRAGPLAFRVPVASRLKN